MDMNDDVLGLVLERVTSHVALIRAAAVCRRWRRAVADAAFLRRYRSLHAPAVAGYYHNGYHPYCRKEGVGAPVFVPSSPRVMDPRRFSLDFLPGGAWRWDVKDNRGSLLLMASPFTTRTPFGFEDHLVCEPLTRRYKRIVLPPPGLDHTCRFLESYLLDGEADEERGLRISMSNFRVLCTFSRGVLFVTTHAAVLAVNSLWSKKSIDHIAPSSVLSWLLGRGGGSWYFYRGDNVLIKLDGSTGEFSSLALPAIEDWDVLISQSRCFVTDGRDVKPRIFTVFNGTMKVFARLDSGDWALDKSVLLLEATRRLRAYQPSVFSHDPSIRTRGYGFAVLSPQHSGMWWPFSVDLDTMDTAPVTRELGKMVYQCELPWPPALHTCL